MNLRAFKKKQCRARAKLIRRHGYNPDAFTPSDPSEVEALYAPHYLKPKHTRRYSIGDAWIKRLIRGTPLMWITSGYYEPETDCYLPSDILAQCEWEPREEEFATLREVTRAWCGRVLCLRCYCPVKCYERGRFVDTPNGISAVMPKEAPHA